MAKQYNRCHEVLNYTKTRHNTCHNRTLHRLTDGMTKWTRAMGVGHSIAPMMLEHMSHDMLAYAITDVKRE